MVGFPHERRRCRRVVVGVRPALGRQPLAWQRDGTVDLRRAPRHRRAAAVGGVRALDGAAAARAGNDADAHAGVHLDDGGDLSADAVRVPGADRRARAAVGAAPLWRRARGRPRGRRLPAVVLVLRAPGRVRDVLSLRGNGGRGPRHLLQQALLRLQRLHRRGARLLRSFDDRVGASHVHDRAGHQQVLRAHLDRARGSRRDRVLRLSRDRVARSPALHLRVPVRDRVRPAVPGRRAHRRDLGLAAAELRPEHVLLHRGALSLHDLRRQRVRPVRGRVLLVRQGHRRAAA